MADPRDYVDRMDPGGELREQMRGLALLATPPLSWALRLMGVPREAIRDARALPQQLEQHLAKAERVAVAVVATRVDPVRARAHR